MKAPDRPLAVQTDSWQRPRKIRLQGWVDVRVLERWIDVGCWWVGERPQEFFRLETAEGLMVEIVRSAGERDWRLYRLYD